jgi:hypothetical protein
VRGGDAATRAEIYAREARARRVPVAVLRAEADRAMAATVARLGLDLAGVG